MPKLKPDKRTEYDGNSIIYKGYKMKAYIPKSYFSKGLAESIGESYLLFNVYMAYHFDDDSDDINSAVQTMVEFPVFVETIPDEVTKEKIDVGYGEEQYIVFIYYANSVLVKDRRIVSDVANVEKLSTLVYEGQLSGVFLDRLPVLINRAEIMNKVSLNVPAFYEETIISTTYRIQPNILEESRFKAVSKGQIVTGVNSRIKAPLNDTFAGSTHEDMDSMFIIAHNRKAAGIEDEPTEIEQVARGTL